MRKPDHVIEVFLQPGEFYFGDVNTRIRTLLGSCVSITMWHPTRLIGGMCHYLLPSRNSTNAAAVLDGRYADDAMKMFLREIRAANTRPSEYRVKVFGGGSMFGPSTGILKKALPLKPASACTDVPCKNVLMARSLIAENGFMIDAEDLGGEGHRQVMFDIWSGHAWVRKPAVNNIQG